MSDPGESLQRVEFHGRADLGFDTIGFIVLSSILACVALLTNSVPILIGAMILAPVFDPLVAVPFAIINRDVRLLRTGLLNSSVLFSVSLAVCFITSWLLLNLPIVPATLAAGEHAILQERLTVGWQSPVTALSAGAGGALAAATQRIENLVGVVVALALIPALAAAAIGFQMGPLPGWRGLELFGINVGGIIVAGLFVLFLRRGSGRAEDEISERRRER